MFIYTDVIFRYENFVRKEDIPEVVVSISKYLILCLHKYECEEEMDKVSLIMSRYTMGALSN